MTRKQSREMVDRLNRDAQRIAARFSLVYRCIEAERANVKRRYGVCYSDGTIRIRLRHATSDKPLKYSSLVNTLCHELAHLRHFNHGLRFRSFYASVLEWARAEGIYEPGRQGPISALPRGRAVSVPGLPIHPVGPGERNASGRQAVGAEAEQLSLFG